MIFEIFDNQSLYYSLTKLGNHAMIPNSIFQMMMNSYPIIGDLPETLQRTIQRDGFSVHAVSGQVAFDYGDKCSAYLFVISGSIRVFKTIGPEREILLYVVRPGDSCVLTVSGIFGNRPYPARGIWEEESVAYGISKEIFNHLITESQPFRTFIFQSFSERISHLMELVNMTFLRPVASRLAQLLLDKRESDSIRCSHQALANELGTVREVVSRILEEFERKGLVGLQRMCISIHDRKGLEKIAQVPTI